MRAHALLAGIAFLAMLAAAALSSGTGWRGLDSGNSLVSGLAPLDLALGGAQKQAPQHTALEAALVGPLQPGAGAEAYALPLVFFAAFAFLYFAVRPSQARAAIVKGDFTVNPRDGSVLLRTGASFSASLAAFEMSPEGELSFQMLLSNASNEPLAFIRVYAEDKALGEVRELGVGEMKIMDVRWGPLDGERRLRFECAPAVAPGDVRRLAVWLPLEDLVELFSTESSMVVLEAPSVAVPFVPAAPAAAVAPSVSEIRARQKAVVEKLRRKAAEAEAPSEAAYKPELPELPAGASLLVEGPIASSKSDFVSALARKVLEGKEGVAWYSFDPQRDIEALPRERRQFVATVPAVMALEDAAISISEISQKKPALAVFDVLYRYAPKYPLDMLLKFLAFNVDKLRKAGVSSVWLLESTVSQQSLAALESEFDAVVEFTVREEHERLVSYYRFKKFKGASFSTELRRWA